MYGLLVVVVVVVVVVVGGGGVLIGLYFGIFAHVRLSFEPVD